MDSVWSAFQAACGLVLRRVQQVRQDLPRGRRTQCRQCLGCLQGGQRESGQREGNRTRALQEPTGDRAYEHLARVLLGARECHRALGTEEAFTAHLAGLRTELKRRPKLMSIHDRHGL
ncbi:hypothetical protein ACWDZ8_45700 [Streptomyces sp. NPDC003233]